MAITARPTTDTRKRDLEIPSADQRWKLVRAHIAKGDKAKDKAEQHYIAAGAYLAQLKADHAGTWAEWEALVKEKAGIGKSRASELMQIGDGRKTVEQTRAEAAERKRIEREQEKSLRDVTENDDQDDIEDDDNDDASDPAFKRLKPAERKALYDEGVALLEKMDPPTRRKFFTYQQRKYLTDFDGAVEGWKQTVEWLENENSKLRKKLDPDQCEFVKDDAGSAAAGYEREGDCVIRAIAIATEKPLHRSSRGAEEGSRRLREATPPRFGEPRYQAKPEWRLQSQARLLPLSEVTRLGIHRNEGHLPSRRHAALGAARCACEPPRGGRHRWRDPRHLRQRRQERQGWR
jgi:hypothetical protein